MEEFLTLLVPFETEDEAASECLLHLMEAHIRCNEFIKTKTVLDSMNKNVTYMYKSGRIEMRLCSCITLKLQKRLAKIEFLRL